MIDFPSEYKRGRSNNFVYLSKIGILFKKNNTKIEATILSFYIKDPSV